MCYSSFNVCQILNPVSDIFPEPVSAYQLFLTRNYFPVFIVTATAHSFFFTAQIFSIFQRAQLDPLTTDGTSGDSETAEYPEWGSECQNFLFSSSPGDMEVFFLFHQRILP
ncbi:unnamed protein product [Arctogadus glacialis]